MPELNVERIKAKIDTGARTSALHAFHCEEFKLQDKSIIRFQIHPVQHDSRQSVLAEAELLEYRQVRNSGGQTQIRPVVLTTIKLGEHQWSIELTLTNRDVMGFRMLLGRQAVRDREERVKILLASARHCVVSLFSQSRQILLGSVAKTVIGLPTMEWNICSMPNLKGFRWLFGQLCKRLHTTSSPRRKPLQTISEYRLEQYPGGANSGRLLPGNGSLALRGTESVMTNRFLP